MPGATDRRSRDQNSMEFLTGKENRGRARPLLILVHRLCFDRYKIDYTSQVLR
jgi:hypothetical protein